MKKLDSVWSYTPNPCANKAAMVYGDKYRFTILTSRLIRIEYDENGIFEDRATQTVINRLFDVPQFKVTEDEKGIRITTEHVEIRYTKGPFSPHSLKAYYVGKNASVKAGASSWEWHFGEKTRNNLKGTARTLDGVNGACELEDGIMSKGEITVLDDSHTLVITDDGWVEPRKNNCIDQYLFCYGMAGDQKFDYFGALKDFYALTGKPPLIPRYTLGNWWSRYYAYTQDEYMELMNRFKKEDIPFSVAVIDMDWHYVTIDSKYGSGWTGYTWNKELFPDHKKFLEFLHNEGLRVTLNLHPQEGIAAHEECYEKMASAMGIDPSTEETVEFDISDPLFMENYFKIVHHPLEDEGVDFWWMDWQQGNTSSVPGLDPLWMLNHYHYIDLGRDGKKRPLVFSRYAGAGSHRYPIGFSGDTHITWESLQFQPYFTATASNIGYGWWSHDIGGHMLGYRDEELMARWVQYGVFSPINRLHSSKNRFTGKEPWKYNKIVELSMKKFLKLRHQMIPYLYSMNYRSANFGEPLVQPLYYKWKEAEAFEYKNEYSFGTEMIVSPIVTPADKATCMGSADTYLPSGIWYDFFTNRRYCGGRKIKAYRDLYHMPVFVKAGGIVPLARLEHVNDIENPKNLLIKIYAGASNMFELYEDDGISREYEKGKFAISKLTLDWSERPVFTVNIEGDVSVIPQNRNYELEFIGMDYHGDVLVYNNGNRISAETSYDNGVFTVKISNVSGNIKVEFDSAVCEHKNDIEDWLASVLERAEVSNSIKEKLFNDMTDNKKSLAQQLDILYHTEADKNLKKAIEEIITSDGLI